MANLEIGSRVHCILYGGKDGVIYAIHGEQRPETVRSIIRGVGVMGGSADFDIVWENGTESRRTPEALIRGSVQWRILDEPKATAEEIKAMREFTASEESRKKAEQAAAAKAFADAETALRIDPRYSHLEQSGKDTYGHGGKLVASNLRREFRRSFPGVKFSVRNGHHCSVVVKWTDGPTTEEVEAFTSRHKGGYFDGMEDIFRHEKSPFSEVFGSVDYLSLNRSYTHATMTEAVRQVCADNYWNVNLVKISVYSDDGAYISTDLQERQREVYDWLEKRGGYENRGAATPGPGHPDYEALKTKVAALMAKKIELLQSEVR